MLRLPLIVIKDIPRHLLVSPNPLILHRDAYTTTKYRSQLQPSVLCVRQLFNHVGHPLLYGNTLTSSTPSTSVNFDAHISNLSGRNRLLITKIRLKIDWAEQPWSKFPLIARYLGELKPLKELRIVIINGEKSGNGAALMVKDPNQSLTIMNHGAGKCMLPALIIAEITLKTEKKVFKELVEDLKALRVFRLEGYTRDEAFACGLEEFHIGRN